MGGWCLTLAFQSELLSDSLKCRLYRSQNKTKIIKGNCASKAGNSLTPALINTPGEVGSFYLQVLYRNGKIQLEIISTQNGEKAAFQSIYINFFCLQNQKNAGSEIKLNEWEAYLDQEIRSFQEEHR